MTGEKRNEGVRYSYNIVRTKHPSAKAGGCLVLSVPGGRML